MRVVLIGSMARDWASAPIGSVAGPFMDGGGSLAVVVRVDGSKARVNDDGATSCVVMTLIEFVRVLTGESRDGAAKTLLFAFWTLCGSVTWRDGKVRDTKREEVVSPSPPSSIGGREKRFMGGGETSCLFVMSTDVFHETRRPCDGVPFSGGSCRRGPRGV